MGDSTLDLNHSIMRFLIIAALCAIAAAAPEGRRLRPEEHWRPAQGRDLSKYKPRAAMVDANGDDLMETLVAPWCRCLAARPLETSGPRLELSPSDHLLDVRLVCPLDSPGPSTTLTGSCPRLECPFKMY